MTDAEMDAYRARIEAKLEPRMIRATLGFAGLYQMVHEAIKQGVVDQVRGFFLMGFDEDGLTYDEEGYQKVLDLAPKKRTFLASLRWLVSMEAITQAQADRLESIMSHRHELTHELMKYIVDVDSEPDVELLGDALSILLDLKKFWTRVEASYGTFDQFEDLNLDEVLTADVHVLKLCIDAYIEGVVAAGDEASPEAAPEPPAA